MTKTLINCGLLALLAATTACSFYARGPEDYAKDTAAVLETKRVVMKQCYDGLLKTDKTAAGTVTVHFMVEKKTGKFMDVKVVPAKTTAPVSLQQCVTSAMSALVLDPPDRRMGDATFTWTFDAAQPAG